MRLHQKIWHLILQKKMRKEYDCQGLNFKLRKIHLWSQKFKCNITTFSDQFLSSIYDCNFNAKLTKNYIQTMKLVFFIWASMVNPKRIVSQYLFLYKVHHIMLFPKSIYVNVTFGYDHIAWKKFLHCDNIPNTVTKCYGTHGRNENMIFFLLKSLTFLSACLTLCGYIELCHKIYP